ncbi:MAG: efflux RND transporter periplasmic adaptor subunit, partial [Cellulomonadaceae bacterium]
AGAIVSVVAGQVRTILLAQGSETADPLREAVTAALQALELAQTQVRSAQESLLAAYDEAEAALLESSGTLAATTDCVGVLDGVCAGLGTADDDQSEGLEACVAAIVAAQEALVATAETQTATGRAQATLAQLGTALDEAVVALAERAEELDAAVAAFTQAQDAEGSDSGGQASDGQGGAGGQGGEQPSTGSMGTEQGGTGSGAPASGAEDGGSGSAAAGGSSGVSVTAERVLADRAAVTLAQAELNTATGALDSADLHAPVAGTVADVQVTAGTQVEAGTAVITILGDEGYVLSTTLDLADAKVVEVGQSVTATVTATGGQYEGTVSSVALLSTSSTSSPSYAATIAISAPEGSLPEGASAAATIDVATVTGVLVVPTSAVSPVGSVRTVRVLTGRQAESVEVTTGAVGAVLTEITTGLEEGAQVVLADLAQQLEDEESSSGLSGLGSQDQTAMPGGSGSGRMPGGSAPMGAPPGM